jgi:hypothetical protein
MRKTKSSESTSVSGSAAWRPQASAAINSVMGVFNQNQPGVQRMADIAQNQVTPALLGKFSAGIGGWEQARGHYSGILSRGLGQNPHLDAMLGQMRGNVSDSVNNNFSMSGRYGSGKHTGVLAKELANNESAMRYQDYNAQMGQQDAAAQALSGMSNAEAAQILGSLGVSAEVPFAGTNALSNALGALFSGGTQKSVSYAPNPIWGAIGAGLGAAGAAFSDRRLKRNIEKVRTRADGLGVYTWIYRNDPDAKVQEGFMADEVREIYPEAYIENFNGTGYQGVNYAAIPHETKLAA